MSKSIEECQELITALGIMSGALPDGGCKIEYEETTLRCLSNFFRAMWVDEQGTCEDFFPEEILTKARPWISLHYYGHPVEAGLNIVNCRAYLRFVLIPKAVRTMADLFGVEMTRQHMDELTDEENNALGDLCLALLSYADNHHDILA